MTTAPPSTLRTASQADPLLVADLLSGPPELAVLLRAALRDAAWQDAYLLAAGLCQMVEDRLHPDPLQLRRAGSYLAGRPPAAARLVALLPLSAAGAAGRARRLTAGHLALVRARHALAELTVRLAALALDPGQSPERATLSALAEDALAAADLLGSDVVRLPACFRSFDQHPDDVRWLVTAYLERRATPPATMCVVGVRTSGSYLAPLHAAELRARGVAGVRILTHRPGRPFLGWERQILTDTARAGGTVLVTDDPPGSGRSLAASLGAIVRAGVPRASVTLALSLFADSPGLPEALASWAAVLQPWSCWSVHQRLSPEPVGAALAVMLGPGWQVDRLRRQPLAAEGSGRGHVSAQFAVGVTDRRTGQVGVRDVLVEGAGLGYFGRHAVAVAEALPHHVPTVYGFADGLLYREWLPAAEHPQDEHAMAEAVVSYASARASALPARHDPTTRLRGRDPVWEVAAALLAPVFGPLALLARPLLLEPLAQRLLRVDSPSIVDGQTRADGWLPPSAASEPPRKVSFHQRAFSHLELACYDPAFDLAGAAADPPAAGFPARLREVSRCRTGATVDPERWLLYRLAHLWRYERAGDLTPQRVARLSAGAVHDYLAEWYLADLPPATGDLCAIDLDGVLETDPLGYPTTSPAGALALRSLRAHGYRVVLATGRSLDDARDRCTALALSGAVAEYGAVAYEPAGDRVTDLRSPEDRRLLEEARRRLDSHALVEVDPDYRYGVRARTCGGPLPAGLVDDLPALREGRLVVVHGDGQSDVTTTALDKATGLEFLGARLDARRWALAVGDSGPDLSMLAMASLGRAPGNAAPAVRAAGVPRTRNSYQEGLLDACAQLLGHRPGRCPACAPPPFPPRARAVLTVLGLREGGLGGIPVRTLRLAAITAAGRRW